MSEAATLPPFFSFARWFRWPTSNEVVIPTSEPNPIADEPKQEESNLEEPKQEQVEEVSPKVEEVCPKVEEVSPKAEEVSPKAEEVSPKVEEVSPKVEEVSPKVEAVCPKVEEVSPKVEEVSPKVDEVSPKVEDVSPKVEKSKPEKLKELKIETSIVMNKPEPKDQNKVVEETLNEVISTIETKPEPHIPINRDEFAQPKQKKNKGAFKK